MTEVHQGQDPVMEQANDALDAVFQDSEEQVEVEATNEVEQDQPAEESFTGFDPQSLPEELMPVYKSLQADYTRKSQENAERAKAYESLEQFGGPEVAVEAVQFAYRLENDPQFAMGVHSQLSQALQAQGMSQPQAQAEATRQIQEQVQPQEDEWYQEDEGYEEPYVDPRVDQLQQKLAQMEQKMVYQDTADAIARQERMLAEQHKDWGEEDWDTVYQLAHATQGNLVQAAEIYEERQNRWIANYLTKKGAVDNKTAEPISAGAAGEEQTGFDTLSDPNLEKAFMKMVEQYGV